MTCIRDTSYHLIFHRHFCIPSKSLTYKLGAAVRNLNFEINVDYSLLLKISWAHACLSINVFQRIPNIPQHVCITGINAYFLHIMRGLNNDKTYLFHNYLWCIIYEYDFISISNWYTQFRLHGVMALHLSPYLTFTTIWNL